VNGGWLDPSDAARRFVQASRWIEENNAPPIIGLCARELMYAYDRVLDAILQARGGSRERTRAVLEREIDSTLLEDESPGGFWAPSGWGGRGRHGRDIGHEGTLCLFFALAVISRQNKSRPLSDLLYRVFMDNIADCLPNASDGSEPADDEEVNELCGWAYAIMASYMQDRQKEECYERLLRGSLELIGFFRDCGQWDPQLDHLAQKMHDLARERGAPLGSLSDRQRRKPIAYGSRSRSNSPPYWYHRSLPRIGGGSLSLARYPRSRSRGRDQQQLLEYSLQKVEDAVHDARKQLKK
jgi:hypothetical protein